MVSPPVSRILYGASRLRDGHPSGTHVAVRLVRPTRDLIDGPPCPCLALLRVGFAEPPRSPGALVVSYTTVSPLPVPGPGGGPSAVCSLLHFPSGRPAWELPSTLPCGVRTFLDRLGCRPRPSGGLTTSFYEPDRFRRPASQPVRPAMTAATRASHNTDAVGAGLPPAWPQRR